MSRPVAEQAEEIMKLANARGGLIVRCVSPQAARTFRRALYRARHLNGAGLSISLIGSDLTFRKNASVVLEIMSLES